MKVRIGTRASKLALWQANEVKRLLEAAHHGIEVELVLISTQGDRVLDRALALIGGKGLFVKEIEQALLEREVDIAVHSAKDLPGEMPPGLTLGGVIEREDPHDVLVSREGYRLDELPPGARVGTGSLRRHSMLLRARPDLDIVGLRGNLDTRLRKVAEGADELDAVILAYAGIRRLGFDAQVTEVLGFETLLPAAGQGVVAIQCREDDVEIHRVLAAIHHEPSALALTAERAMLAEIEGSCHLPVAGHAWLEGETLHFEGRVVSPDGLEAISGRDSGPASEAREIGLRMARWLLSQGADAIIARVLREMDQAALRLDGVPVIVTRSKAQAGALSELIAKRGGEPIEIPTLSVEAVKPAVVAEACEELSEGAYDWVIFTSTNGVNMTLAALSGPLHVGTTRVAAVGLASKEALEQHGVRTDLVPALQTSEGLLEALLQMGVGRGSRCLLLTAELTRGVLTRGLTEAGAIVDEVTVYRTKASEGSVSELNTLLARNPAGYLTFASGSAAKSFFALIDGVSAIAGWKVACIGPVTANVVRAAGVNVEVLPKNSTIEELVAAIAEHHKTTLLQAAAEA